ncbi:hypothetical protein AgCh_016979 [Apium graveolens]
MNRHVMNCKNSKHMWETIEVINEGTEEVRENKLEILTSEYEHFKSNPGEGITEVFERYNALINNLNINGKYYSMREVNKKFLLTLPTHLEHRITAIREARDLSEISLDRLYGVLKTYELEQIQQKEVYGKDRVVSTSTALVAKGQQQQQQSQQSERMVQFSKAEENVIVAEYDPPTTNQSSDDFYSLEELEQLEDESMTQIVKKFSNVRFKRNPKFKYKSNYNRFQTECRKPKQVRKNSYDSNQKSNSERAYLEKGRSWDDTDSEDEEDDNLALMAIDGKASSSRKEVKFTDAGLFYHLGGSLDCARRDNELLKNRVDCYRRLETILKDKITGLETKVRAYFNSCLKAKEFYSINSPPHVYAKGRKVPHVLKDVDEPLYKRSIAELFDTTSSIIQEEMRAEDLANEKVVSKSSVSKVPLKVVKATETNSDTHELDNKNAMSIMHIFPVVNLSYKACGVSNYSPDEPKGEMSLQTRENTKDQMPTMTASVILQEIQTLEESSQNDRKLVLYKERELQTSIVPLPTSSRMAPMISVGITRLHIFSNNLRFNKHHFLVYWNFMEQPLSHLGKGKAIVNTALKISVSKQALIPTSSGVVLASTELKTSFSKQDNTTVGDKRVDEEKVDATIDLIQDAFQVADSTYDEFGDEVEEDERDERSTSRPNNEKHNKNRVKIGELGTQVKKLTLAADELKDMMRLPTWWSDAYSYCLETKFEDNRLLTKVKNIDWAKQVVLLTDGMDTRPYRFNWPKSTLVFDISSGNIFK